MKNAIRSLFANRGIEIASGKRAWCTGRELINTFRKSIADCSMDELWKGQLDIELTQLDAMTEQLREVERRLEVIAKQDARIKRLQTIPGVGPSKTRNRTRYHQGTNACLSDAANAKP